MPPVRILIADDHPGFRAGLRALIGSTSDLEVVEEAGTVEEAVHRSARIKSDVVVMDLRLPDGSGIDATRRILAERPETSILMLSMHEDDASVFDAMRAGAPSVSCPFGTNTTGGGFDSTPSAAAPDRRIP